MRTNGKRYRLYEHTGVQQDAETSALQDLLLQGHGAFPYAVEGQKKFAVAAVSNFTVKAIFSTLTNVI